MLVVPVVIAPQRLIALLGIRPNWWRLDKVKVVLDKREGGGGGGGGVCCRGCSVE